MYALCPAYNPIERAILKEECLSHCVALAPSFDYSLPEIMVVIASIVALEALRRAYYCQKNQNYRIVDQHGMNAFPRRNWKNSVLCSVYCLGLVSMIMMISLKFLKQPCHVCNRFGP